MPRILLIGLGRWGANHFRVLRSLPVELHVSDLDPRRLEWAVGQGIPAARAHADFRDGMRHVDAAVVATPAPDHFPIATELLRAGKDLFIEKPLAATGAEAWKLAGLAESTGRLVQVGHILRFDPAARWLKARMEAGAFGRMLRLRALFSGFKRPRSDTGVGLADAIHFVDLCAWLLGRAPLTVLAAMQDCLGRGMEDAAWVALEFPGEGSRLIQAVIEADYFAPGKHRSLLVVGSEQTALCDFNVAQYKIRLHAQRHVGSLGEWRAEEGPVEQVETPPEEPLLSEMRAFIDSLASRVPAGAGAAEGYQAVRILEAAQLSAQTGRKISLQ